MQKLKIKISAKNAEEFFAAKALLKKSKISVITAARLALEFFENLNAPDAPALLAAAREFAVAHAHAAVQKNAPSFDAVFENYLQNRAATLRARTLADYRYLRRRIARKAPNFSRKNIAEISPDDCADALSATFPTARQSAKGRTMMSVIFNYAVRREWSEKNPAAATDVPKIVEREIFPLSPKESRALVSAARKTAGNRGAAAGGLMLYAGIRPAELTRVRAEDFDLAERVVCVPPSHSKTGGARQIEMRKPLFRLLEPLEKLQPEEKIIPANWQRKWRRIRHACGFRGNADDGANAEKMRDEKRWQQDVLRHTFASWHLKFFQNPDLLRTEMGHSSFKLLHSRYLNMRGLTRADAAGFWK